MWKKKNRREKKTNLNKKKRKWGGERKSQRNQKSDNSARGKSFRFTGERRGARNPVGGGEKERKSAGRQKQKRKKAYEEGRLGGEDRGRSGKEGLKLLADISSGEQAR